MYLEKAFVVILWLIFAMALLGGGYALLNVSNTFANFGGVLLILVTIYVTIKTQCLTILFFAFMTSMLALWTSNKAYLHFQENSLMSKICSFFNKDVF